MKWIIALLLVCSCSLFAEEASLQFEQANELYRKADFQKAAQLYEQVLSNGYESAALYYNLGNAYFKLQNIPAAILQYERARRLAPHDEDILYNLRLANLRVIDKIEPIPQLFFVSWWNAFINFLSASGWTVVAIVAFWCAAIGGGIFLVSRSVLLQRITFAIAVLGIVLGILAFVGTYQRNRVEQNENTAIVFAQTVSVKSAPDAQSTDLFVVHEGVKVEFLDLVGDWRKIRLQDGKVGWLPMATVRTI